MTVHSPGGKAVAAGVPCATRPPEADECPEPGRDKDIVLLQSEPGAGAWGQQQVSLLPALL